MPIFSLNGTWQLATESQEPIPAQVPGCVHADLLAAGRIPDPYYRDNEDRLQWIGERDWRYTRRFTVPAALLAHEVVRLRCHGLDTLATITLNGHEVACTDNMYRTWDFDVKALLVAGENEITVTFASVLAYIAARRQEHPLASWSGPKETQGRAWVRKEPCNFGWDWGPVLVTAGIWRDIELVAFSTARLADVQILQDHATPGQVTLEVAATAETTRPAELSVHVTVSFGNRLVASASSTLDTQHAALVIRDPALWWPNGLGAQPLYDLTVELLEDGAVIDTLTRRIGLRTLTLERHPDRWGESFYFACNGVPFFAKGANWIPADAILTRLTKAHYAGLLTAAAEAHMNMLRVWGGGIYEQDGFYDLCDALGICVWQDFMFACSVYPVFDQPFLHNVRAEMEDVVRRLRHHPSLALWCGNNELEMGLVGLEWSERRMTREDYGTLFDTLLPTGVRALDPQRAYWPCSPHSPHGGRDDHSNPQWGDAHLWDVWHGKQPFEWYRTCTHRFCSEFGFQSFPEPKTVCAYTAPEDYNITSYVMEHHQRSGIGNATIIGYLLEWFRLPAGFEMSLWLSQILHGMAMKYAVEHWRRNMPRSMGTLYWQLNDCWPVASWASIDYYGRWKALHYLARAFYAPLLISGLEDPEQGTVEVHVTSDRRDACRGTVRWILTGTDGTPLDGGARPVEIAPLASARVETLGLAEYLQEHTPRGVLVWLELEVEGEIVSSNLVTFARPKHLELCDPNINVRVEMQGDAYRVTLETNVPALWTWLELERDDARYSDNFVHLRPGRPVTLTVTPAVPLTPEAFSAQLRVRSLVDTHRERVGSLR